MSDVPGSTRLYFPALAPLYNAFSKYSYAFMRFAAGAVLVPHGWVKLSSGAVPIGSMEKLGLPLPYLWAYLTAGVEFFGAIMLAIGLFTRFAAAAIAIEMFVIIFFLQWSNGYFWTKQGYEYALLWMLLCIAIFFRGGGEYSVDAKLGKEL
jgi:putative oxidoreductase